MSIRQEHHGGHSRAVRKGRYRFELARDPASGTRRFISKGGFTSVGEARRALANAVTHADEGRLVPRNGHTLTEWLDQWLERAALTGSRPPSPATGGQR